VDWGAAHNAPLSFSGGALCASIASGVGALTWSQSPRIRPTERSTPINHNKNMKIFSFLQKLLFPWRCLRCGKFDEILCPICREKIEFLEFRYWCLFHKGQQLNAYSFFEYQEASFLVQRLIKLLKYQSMEGILESLEKILLSRKMIFRRDWGFNRPIYYLPVPLHRRRYCERGFNQSLLLAKIFQKIWPGEIVEDLLVRNEYTIAQASLNRENRLDNLQGKFKLQAASLRKLDKDALFIIVDDVITTGSTMFSLIELLKTVEIKNYLAMSLARD